MSIQFTAQILKSFAGAAICGLGLDAASWYLTSFFWSALREVVSLLFWGALVGLHAAQAQVLGLHLYSLACPLQMLVSLRPLLHLIGAAV